MTEEAGKFQGDSTERAEQSGSVDSVATVKEDKQKLLVSLKEKMRQVAHSSSEKVDANNSETVRAPLSAEEQAFVFADRIDLNVAESLVAREQHEVAVLLKTEKAYYTTKDHSRAEKRQHEKNIKELSRYGYKIGDLPSQMLDSDVISEPYEQRQLGRERAEDWKLLSLALNGDRGKDCKKSLKKKGFSKIPEYWDDKDFTSYEMRRMAVTARAFLDNTPR